MFCSSGLWFICLAFLALCFVRTACVGLSHMAALFRLSFCCLQPLHKATGKKWREAFSYISIWSTHLNSLRRGASIRNYFMSSLSSHLKCCSTEHWNRSEYGGVRVWCFSSFLKSMCSVSTVPALSVISMPFLALAFNMQYASVGDRKFSVAPKK